ncbi:MULTISPECIES: WDGH domain-containing protein [unclassified Streptomyces]|uniref:WDGH domain-containing protein n=1 Tax=unclassified Streptomyces TaxID=2593676 RepID=UPI000BF18FEA|nr:MULTISPECIES: hypothetical protein [unclassified Streptomyces]
MTTQPERIALDDLTSDALDALHARAEAADTVYRERAHLVALLAALHPSYIGHTDPTAPDWAVVIIETPAGQMSWHIAPRDMDLFTHVQPVNRICRGWDGHTTDEKYQRMRDLTEAAPSLLSLETIAEHQRGEITRLKTEVARLTAGQCTDQRAMCEQHHAPPVAGCPYPRCRAARATGRTATA